MTTATLAAPPAQPPRNAIRTSYDLPEPDPSKSWNVILLDGERGATEEFRLMFDPVITEKGPGQFSLRLFVDTRDPAVSRSLTTILASRDFKAVGLAQQGDAEWFCLEVSYGRRPTSRETYPEGFAARVMEVIRDENRSIDAHECEEPEFVAAAAQFPRTYDPSDILSEEDYGGALDSWSFEQVRDPAEESPSVRAASMGYFVTKLTSASSSTRRTARSDPFPGDEVSVTDLIAQNVVFPIAAVITEFSQDEFSRVKPGFVQVQGNLAIAIRGMVARKAEFRHIEIAIFGKLHEYREELGMSARVSHAVITGNALKEARAIYQRDTGSK